jgi:hypothetical protein
VGTTTYKNQTQYSITVSLLETVIHNQNDNANDDKVRDGESNG